MKRLLAIGLVFLTMMAFGATRVLAPPMPTRAGLAELILDAMPPEDGAWFSIEPAMPSFDASLSYCIDDPLYHFAYYLNDHTFAELNYLTGPPGSLKVINLKGSYLFDFGLFVGLEYYHLDPSMDTYFLSPGYRYKLGDRGYLAAGFDYRYMNDAGEIIGWELTGQYNTGTMAVSGEAYLSADTGNALEIEANFKASENLVWGAGVTYADVNGSELGCFAGLTWVQAPFILNVKAGNDAAGLNYNFGGYYAVSEKILLGLAYGAESGADDPRLICSATYSTKLMNLGLIYRFANGYDPAMAYLTYDLKF